MTGAPRTPRAAVPVALVVRAQVAVDAAGDRFAGGLEQRVARLRDDGEAGSQVAEYALIGGVGAAACGGIVKVLKETGLLQDLLSAVVSTLTRTLRSWF